MSESSQRAAMVDLKLSGGRLSRPFSADRPLHFARVGSGAESITITPVPAEQGARIEVNGRAILDPQSSATVSLQSGRNLIEIRVTAPDGGESKQYTLKAYRCFPAPDWVQVAESGPWRPRDSAGELVFDEKMWLFGGYLPELVSDVWTTTDGRSWRRHADVPAPKGINIPVCFVHDGKMWMTSNDGKFFSSPDGETWSVVHEHPPWAGRYAAGAAVFRGRMWVLGGSGQGKLHNDVWSSADGADWTLEVAEAPWSKRQLFGMVVVHDGKLWLLGGGVTNYHPFCTSRDVWNSADGVHWTKVVDEAPWIGRIWSNAVSYRGRLWVFGGFRAEPEWTNLNDVWYSTDGTRWERLETETVWSPRHEVSAYVYAGGLWVIGGNSWPLMNDAWRLEICGLTFLTQPPVECLATAEYVYKARADFGDAGPPVRYRLKGSPAWLAVDERTGAVRGVPPEAGEFAVTIEAFNTAGETARQGYTLHVFPIG